MGQSIFVQLLEPRRLLSQTFYVDASSPGPTRDGSSWTKAYTSLPSAITAAASGDQILIADGTYKPTTTFDRTISFQLKSGVGIYGGYAGYGAANPDARDPATYATVLSGNIGSATSSADNSFHVVSASGVNATAVLDGVTVSGGNANGSTSYSFGGGVFISAGTPTISNCSLTQNAAANAGGAVYGTNSAAGDFDHCGFSGNSVNSPDSGGGGAIYLYLSSATINVCTFTSNSAGLYGGAIYNGSTNTTSLTNCTFTNNIASGGGAIYSESNPNLIGCTFTNNTATQMGGAAYIAASPQFTTCTFTSNSAPSAGGAIECTSGTPKFSNCSFTSNQAVGASTVSGRGGAIDCELSSPILTGCSFSHNSALGSSPAGGAIQSYSVSTPGGTPKITNCTFTANYAGGASGGSGGAIANQNQVPTILNCAFVANGSVSSGGAIDNNTSSSYPLVATNCTFSGNYSASDAAVRNIYGGTFTNCIIWGNTASDATQYAGSATYSDVQGGLKGTGNLNVPPVFVRFPSPGPDLVWGTSDDDFGDVRLLPSSPVADAGNNSAVPSGTTSDLAGNARFVDVATTADTGLGTSPIVDMGAYEAVGGIDSEPGGPYLALQGTSSLTLTGHGAGTVPGPLQFAWDFSGNGQFTDASGPAPTISLAGYVGGTSIPIALRVTDAVGVSAIANTTIWIAPADVYVDPRATSGAATGVDWANSFTSLQLALSQALAGQTIHVAGGIYKPTASTQRTASFHLLKNVMLLGGYAGLGAADPNARDVVATPSILSGDIGVAGDNSDNSYNVIYAASTNATAVIDGFSITGGNATGGQTYGGGIYITGGGPSLRNCTFRSNNATFGGALYVNGFQPTLTNCSFIDNTGNTGGALYLAGGSPGATINDCTFSGNVGSSFGGAIYSDTSAPHLLNCSFIGNTSKYGAAIYGSQSILPQVLAITNCTFTANTSSISTGTGTAIFCYSQNPSITNCVIWNNPSTSGTPIATSAASPTVSYCDVQGGYGGNGNINTDPQFVRSPSAGADAVWGTADDDLGNLQLGLGSACIDSGSNAAIPTTTTTDLANHPRFVDVPGAHDPGVLVDMGAYEFAQPVTAYAGPASNGLKLFFNQNLDPSTLSRSDLLLTNLDDGVTLDPSSISSFFYDSNGFSGLWGFAGLLPDGNYRASLPAGSLSDGAGAATSQDIDVDFFLFAGDANHDRTIDTTDFAAMAQHFNQAGMSFEQGDFNNDGRVNAMDFNIIASKFGTTLTPLVTLPLSSFSPTIPLTLFSDRPVVGAYDLIG